jgi:D-sedoheptulose 7-phosphate isomerase
MAQDRRKLMKDQLTESADVKMKTIGACMDDMVKAAVALIEALKKGHKVLIFGNGGSAADAQHIACELVSKFRLERKGLPAISLTTNTSIISAISNDYDYKRVFERQIEALGQKGDVAIGISTSGKSPNILSALKLARKMGLVTIGMEGEKGRMRDEVDIDICVPSGDTPRIQEAHITIGHILCDVVEKELFE